MKRIWLVVAFVLLAFGTGAIMPRTPITKPGFDNISSLIDLDTSFTQFVDTAAEEEIYRVTIPRNTLGLTDRVVKVELDYVGYNFSGGAKEIVWRVYYGGSVAIATPADAWGNTAAQRFSRVVVWLVNWGAIDAQGLMIRDEDNKWIGAVGGIAEDSNTELDLVITAQFSAAHANLELDRMVVLTTQMSP